MRKISIHLLSVVGVAALGMSYTVMAEGGPSPTEAQIRQFTEGDFAAVKAYLGEKNPVIMVNVYKTVVTYLPDSNGKMWQKTYHASIVQSGSKDFPVGIPVRWTEFLEGTLTGSVTQYQGGELYYVVTPYVKSIDPESGERILDWRLGFHIAMNRARSIRGLRGVLTIPEVENK